MLKSVHFKNFLSFGPDAAPVELGPLNVVIGANGSGKSNLIEGIGILRSTPKDLAGALRKGGGTHAWFWRDSPRLDLEAMHAHGAEPVRHAISLRREGSSFAVEDERIAIVEYEAVAIEVAELVGRTSEEAHQYLPDGALVNIGRIDPRRSLIEARRDPQHYPKVAEVADAYERTRIYRDWSFGSRATPRQAQPTDLMQDGLSEDGANLALILHNLPTAMKERVREHVAEVYDGAADFRTVVNAGSISLFLEEDGGAMSVPAPRISDGTLRWLALIAILLDPNPARLVCIDEPELGLHPDLVHILARLLREAAERTQLIVTTHSDALIDALTDTPEDVLVCERLSGSTNLRRLERARLQTWLEVYKDLGSAWRSGVVGGTRW